MMTRTEHVTWCKERALEYIEQGQPHYAYSSMVSDMGKHDETLDAIRSALAEGAAIAKGGDPEAMRLWIEGFSE